MEEKSAVRGKNQHGCSAGNSANEKGEKNNTNVEIKVERWSKRHRSKKGTETKFETRSTQAHQNHRRSHSNEHTTVNYINKGKAEKDKKKKQRQYIKKLKACKEVRGQLDQLNNNTIAELAVSKLIEKPANKRKDNNHKRKMERWT